MLNRGASAAGPAADAEPELRSAAAN
jgi:hypothetical protein